jgi:hypothetical protein
MPAPLVSVICPTYNRSRRILPTLRSVRAQRMPDWELLVISDGSTNDTDDVVASVAAADDRVRLVRTRRHGHPSPVREVGLAEARGAIVAYLDHDDVWLPGHLDAVLGAFGIGSGSGPGAGAGAGSGTGGVELVATGAVRTGPDGSVTSVTGLLDLLWHPELQVASPLFEPSRVAHRAGLPAAVGGWREPATGLEDWDLWLRLTDAGARFTTVDARTVQLADGGPSRRTRVGRGHLLWLAEFAGVAQAAQAVAGLRAGGVVGGLRAAARADQLAWYRDLAATGELRWPHRPAAGPRSHRETGKAPAWSSGGVVTPDAVAALVERALAAAGPEATPWPDLVVRRRPRPDPAAARTGTGGTEDEPGAGGGRVGVGLPLWCATVEHAERLGELLGRRQAAQLGLTRRLLQLPGGGDGDLRVDIGQRAGERREHGGCIPDQRSAALVGRPRTGEVSVMMSGMDVTVAETFLLLTLDEAGKDAAGAGSDAGVAGGLLADLVLAGALRLDTDSGVLTPGTPPSSENVPLREAYGAIEASGTAPALADALRTLLKDLAPVRETVAARLVASGVLGTERGRIFRVVRHPIAEPGPSEAARDELIAALTARSAPGPAAGETPALSVGAVLLGLLRPFGLVEQLVPARPKAEVAARAGALIDADALARLLGDAVGGVRTTLVASLAAAAASTAAATG